MGQDFKLNNLRAYQKLKIVFVHLSIHLLLVIYDCSDSLTSGNFLDLLFIGNILINFNDGLVSGWIILMALLLSDITERRIDLIQ